jgi:hypothetical protein
MINERDRYTRMIQEVHKAGPTRREILMAAALAAPGLCRRDPRP